MPEITFKQAALADKPLIREWWNAPHVKEFWDNGPEMWQNVENYLEKGQKDLFDYWLGHVDGEPFALVMSSVIDPNQDDIYGRHCAETGITCSLDFMIGNLEYLGKGLAAPTLQAFMVFCPDKAIKFLIDPAVDNTRAVHVYSKAGFVEAESFTPEIGSFAGIEHRLMSCVCHPDA